MRDIKNGPKEKMYVDNGFAVMISFFYQTNKTFTLIIISETFDFSLFSSSTRKKSNQESPISLSVFDRRLCIDYCWVFPVRSICLLGLQAVNVTRTKNNNLVSLCRSFRQTLKCTKCLNYLLSERKV